MAKDTIRESSIINKVNLVRYVNASAPFFGASFEFLQVITCIWHNHFAKVWQSSFFFAKIIQHCLPYQSTSPIKRGFYQKSPKIFFLLTIDGCIRLTL